MNGDYQLAIDEVAKLAELPNDLRLITAASYAHLEKDVEAKREMDEFTRNDPYWSVAKSAAYSYGKDGDRQRWISGLRRAGLKEW
jgi:adenylate cyclase